MRTTFLSLPLLIWLALLVMMLVRFAIMFGTGPLHDEAYYWSWSQELDFGYYDQPFLTGWLLAPFVALLGDGAWVMRAVATLLIFAASAFLALTVNALSRPPTAQNAQQGRNSVEGSGSAALSGFLLLALTSPVLWSVGLFYVHDTVMVCFLSLGLWLGTVFVLVYQHFIPAALVLACILRLNRSYAVAGRTLASQHAATPHPGRARALGG